MSGTPGDPWKDLEKIGGLLKSGDRSFPALVELIFISLTALVAFGWLVSMLWVPDTIASRDWMFGGMLGMAACGVPAAAIYAARRGGIEALIRIISEVA